MVPKDGVFFAPNIIMSPSKAENPFYRDMAGVAISLTLFARADDQGLVDLSVADIEAVTGSSRAKVRSTIKRLERMGLLTRRSETVVVMAQPPSEGGTA